MKEAEAYLQEQKTAAMQEHQKRLYRANALDEEMSEIQRAYKKESNVLNRQDMQREMAEIREDMADLRRGSYYNEKYLAEVDFQLESLSAYKNKEYRQIQRRRISDPQKRAHVRSEDYQEDVPTPIKGNRFSTKGFQQVFGNPDLARKISAFEQRTHYV